mmetsp:Transcript_15289/g.43749  ORF Transcript_15289/g.43749 Transcript_15289/m.43749 type:complete len:454 (+) Transcript_15289:102-1463(+)
MVHPAVFAIATGIGLLTDKYMLEATNFVDHYAVKLKPTHEEKEFIKSAMYAGAIFGMVTFGPLSDFVGRRRCLLACSAITLLGAVMSTGAWNAKCLIAARIITGIGMGGEYPLASTHSAENSDSGNGARNVALLYLFGSGGGPAICDLVTYFLDISGMPPQYIWRCIFLVGALLSLAGLVLRFVTTKDSKKLTKAAKNPKGTRRTFFKNYWRPLLGTSLIWLLFDIVEYGLKQNDSAIFSDDSAIYSASVLKVFVTRVLVIPSLAFAPWLLTKLSSKWVQIIGFSGCIFVNLVLAIGYHQLQKLGVLFVALYIIQLSFQSLPGVTTMAIPAEIYPSAVRGTGAAISAASGKVGATLGSFFFTMLSEDGKKNEIFWVVTAQATLALVLTLVLTPHYNGATLDMADALATEGKTKQAAKTLYSGPRKASEVAQVSNEESGESSSGEEEEKSSSED